jgi:hypothetical protein
MLTKQLQHFTLALLRAQTHIGAQEAVATVYRSSAGIALCQGIWLGLYVFLGRHEIA